MCGINGFVDFKNKYTSEVRHNIVHQMNEKIIHRGPDMEGIYDSHWFSMGMRRLAIVDLDSGGQPIYSEDRSLVVVFNGEIYNYKVLKRRLIQKGYTFKTSSDTEVIVNLFHLYGVKSFTMLDGMFAISLFDIKNQILYLVRDRMGEKPFYYYLQENELCYGSELKSLLQTGIIKKEICTAALNFYVQYSYIPAPYTIFENVYKLCAGNYLQINSNGEMAKYKYWELEHNTDIGNLDYNDAQNELRRLLYASVKARMNCDVPFGAFLSGGIDSGVIAGLMSKISEKPVNTFTIGFEEKEYDERRNAAYMAKYLGTKHHESILTYKNAIDIIDKILADIDEPFGDSSAIPEYLVSHFASRYVKVVLTGDAGDELFLGYEKYLINYYAEKYLVIPTILRRKLIEPVLYRIPDKSVLSRKAKKVVDGAYYDIFARRNRIMQLGFKDEESIKLFKPEYLDMSGQELIRTYYEKDTSRGELSQTQYTDLMIILEGDMLTKVDRMCMLNSLENRAPLLANDVVEFAYSIPDNYKLIRNKKKRILRESFPDIFPKGFDKLPKSGFSIPLDYWFRNEMKERVLDLLSAQRLAKQKIFCPEYVEQIIKEHISGKVNRKTEIWNLYVFQKWYENYM